MHMFEYVMVLASIIVGLAITHLLQGVAAIVQHPSRSKPYWVHLVWVGYAFLQAAFWWWWEYRFQATQVWTFQLYAFVLGYAVLIYLLCAMLFPKDLGEFTSFEEYYYARRIGFFSLNAGSFAVDLFDTALKGAAHFASLGLEYWFGTAANIGFSLVAIFTRNKRFHAAFALAAFVYQISWALRYFDTVR